MNDDETYIYDSIKTWVWSGFQTLDEVYESIDDIIEPGTKVDRGMLREFAPQEFARKKIAEKTWPAVTDCERLDQAFEKLEAIGIVALHNAGMTTSDGRSDVAEVVSDQPEKKYIGYCFYHGQDLERVLEGHGLWLAFDDVSESDDAKAVLIGKRVVEALTGEGLTVDWASSARTRILMPKFIWQRRGNT